VKIIVSQKGAREHYAVARALHQQGMLAGLVTDWYAPPWLRRMGGLMDGWMGRRGSAALAARCEDIPDRLVRAFPFRSLLWKWRVRRLAAQGRGYEAHLQTDAAFAAAVARLKLPPHEVFFGYSYACLEMLQAEKERGKMTILCQIDPGPVHFRIVAEEMARHPELAGPPAKFPEAYFDRARREWGLADIIVVNSEWSREALVAEGADAAKIEVLPLAFEINVEMRKVESGKQSDTSPRPSPRSGEGLLRVLFLGQVTPGKGIHYLMAAARLLERENIHFDVVGPVGILPGAVAAAPRNMTFHGPVSRDRAAEWYRQSDVFVLPTLSDGFALTQLEALAHGLPVIATPNCGRVVVSDKTGFLIPPRDARVLTDAILKFAANRNLPASMATACREAVKAYSVETFGRRLVEVIQKYSVKR
jgi:glycosyltransferase involved in cell wall biosynthesis